MINLHCPDFYTGFKVYEKLIELYINAPEAFRGDVNLTKIFGALPGMSWNGGTVFQGTVPDIRVANELANFYYQNGIALKLTLTNPILNETDKYDRYCNAVVAAFENDLNEILVSTDDFESFLREKYPLYKFDKSIVGNTIQHKNQTIEELINILEKNQYETIVLPRKFTKDIDFLRAIPEQFRSHIEILLNDLCPLNCPRLGEHYQIIGHAQLCEQQYMEEATSCLNRKIYPIVENKKDMISYEEIKEVYEPLGYSEFKISGRWWKPSIALNVVRYFIQPEYQFDILHHIFSSIYPAEENIKI